MKVKIFHRIYSFVVVNGTKISQRQTFSGYQQHDPPTPSDKAAREDHV